jgi:hypothetical protein
VIAACSIARDEIARNLRAWLAITIGATLAYYAGLVCSVVVRLGHLPNYVTFYDWPANVLRIVQSTPSVHDMVPIILDEWLVEIGYMNPHYGRGIAEWSLAIIPSRVAISALLGAGIATSALLWRRSQAYCRPPAQGAAIAATGLGALSVGTANITMTWVACCAAPSWVVGLSLVGVESTSAFALLPYGDLLLMSGFAVLLTTIYLLAHRCVPSRDRVLPPGRLVTQDH